MRIKVAATSLGAMVALAGCVPAPSAPTAPSPTPTADLASLHAQFGLVDCPETDPAAEAVEGGLPRTALHCLGTDQVVNLAGLPREPMVVNLWAQWCVPCREEAPFLREGMAELEGVRFVGINYNDPQTDWAVEFAGVVGWTYPHVVDIDKSLRIPMKVPGLPTTYFVAADGTIAGVHAGQLESTQQLRDLVAEHLGQP